MSSEQRVIIQFLHKEKVHQPKFTKGLQHSMALKLTIFEAFNIGVNSSTAGAKTYTVIRGQEDPRLIISTPKSLHAWRGNRSLRHIRWPWLSTSRLHKSLGMKKFHLRWVLHQLTDDLRQLRVAKCGEILLALEGIQRIQFHHIMTGNERWFYLN
jgi:hypothetical protein